MEEKEEEKDVPFLHGRKLPVLTGDCAAAGRGLAPALEIVSFRGVDAAMG